MRPPAWQKHAESTQRRLSSAPRLRFDAASRMRQCDRVAGSSGPLRIHHVTAADQASVSDHSDVAAPLLLALCVPRRKTKLEVAADGVGGTDVEKKVKAATSLENWSVERCAPAFSTALHCRHEEKSEHLDRHSACCAALLACLCAGPQPTLSCTSSLHSLRTMQHTRRSCHWSGSEWGSPHEIGAQYTRSDARGTIGQSDSACLCVGCRSVLSLHCVAHSSVSPV